MNVLALSVGDPVGIQHGHRGAVHRGVVVKVHKNGVTVESNGKQERFTARGRLVGSNGDRWSGPTELIPADAAEKKIAADALRDRCRNAWYKLLEIAEKYHHNDLPMDQSVVNQVMAIAKSIPVVEATANG